VKKGETGKSPKKFIAKNKLNGRQSRGEGGKGQNLRKRKLVWKVEVRVKTVRNFVTLG